MTRVCTVCAHPQKDAIDQALVVGETYRDIAGQFAVSRSALERHKADHLPATLAKAEQAAEVSRADKLIEEINKIQDITWHLLARASAANNLAVAMQGISQARKNLELQARLLGELQENQTNVNVLVASPEWIAVQTRLLRALEPFPAARMAIVEALRDS